jgi:hypothetical protein
MEHKPEPKSFSDVSPTEGRPQFVGILAAQMYFPSRYVSQEALGLFFIIYNNSKKIMIKFPKANTP